MTAPITGFQLYALNKSLPDTGCKFDPGLDPNFSATTGTGAITLAGAATRYVAFSAVFTVGDNFIGTGRCARSS